MKGFQEAAQKADRRVVMLSSGSDYKKEAEFIGRLGEFDVKGAVVFPLLATPLEVTNFSQLLVTAKHPIVLTEVSLPALGLPTVTADSFHASYTMTRHLLEAGAERIGFFANYAHIPSVRDEYRGYLWALEERGLKPPNNSILMDPEMNPDFDNPLNESSALARRYFSKNPSVDAVVCANDFLAAGCIVAAKEAKLDVPGQLKVVSCDDYGLSAIQDVSITTYRIPHRDVGRKTFDMLAALVANEPPPSNEILVRGKLIPGTSA